MADTPTPDRPICGTIFGPGIVCDLQPDHHPASEDPPTHSGIDPGSGTRKWAHMLATAGPVEREPGHVYVIFDGPPGPESGRFVEVEDHLAASVDVGCWLDDDRHPGWVMLQIAVPPADRRFYAIAVQDEGQPVADYFAVDSAGMGRCWLGGGITGRALAEQIGLVPAGSEHPPAWTLADGVESADLTAAQRDADLYGQGYLVAGRYVDPGLVVIVNPSRPTASPEPGPGVHGVLIPAESMAVTVALAQVLRGEAPAPNTATLCVLALARLNGRHDWTVSQIVHRLPETVVELDDGTTWLRAGARGVAGWEYRHPDGDAWLPMGGGSVVHPNAMVEVRRPGLIPEPMAVSDVDRMLDGEPVGGHCDRCDEDVTDMARHNEFHASADKAKADTGGEADLSPVAATRRLARMAGFLLGVTEVLTPEQATECWQVIQERNAEDQPYLARARAAMAVLAPEVDVS